MVEWTKFLSALEARGTSFQQVRGASDPTALIRAVGFTDPLDVAVLETEWAARAQQGTSASAPSRIPAQTVAPQRKKLPCLHAVDVAALRSAPEELQEAVVAEELLYALRGHGGELIAIGPDRRAFATQHVPESIAALVAPLTDVPLALGSLEDVEQYEFSDLKGSSRVQNAVAEAVREVTAQYIRNVTDLAERCLHRPLPLARLVAEVQVCCHPVRRLAQLFDDIAQSQGNALDGVPGGFLLHELLTRYTRCVGNTADERLVGFVLRRGAEPYAAMIDRWMYRGELDDPHGEFFVRETGVAPRANDALYVITDQFQMHRDRVPGFLLANGMHRLIFYAGKYCHLIRESGGEMPVVPDEERCFAWGDTEALEAAVTRVHDAASRAVVQILLHKYRLVERLESLKLYFLHGRGDWLVNFLEAAKDMLSRPPSQVKSYTLNMVLQAEIARACGDDPFHGSIKLALSDRRVHEVVDKIREADPDMQQVPVPSDNTRRSVRRSGAFAGDNRRVVDLLQLQLESDWLLSLVFNQPFIVKLNVIFRILLWCKRCERELNEAWWKACAKSAAAAQLRLKLLQFVRQYCFYAVHHVLDPAWSAMMDSVREAESIDRLSMKPSAFCDDAFRGLIVRSEHGFKALTSILMVIEKFCAIGYRARNEGVGRDLINGVVRSCNTEFNNLLAELGDPARKDYGRIVPLLTWLDFSGYYERQGVYRVRIGAAAHDELQAARERSEDSRAESTATASRPSGVAM